MRGIGEIPADGWTPARLWTQLDRETRGLAARALFDPAWNDASGRAEADRAIATALRFREAAVRRLPVAKRIDYLVHRVRPDDSLARSLLTALHLVQRRPMLAAFLDALGVPQTDGVIDPDHEVRLEDGARVRAAVDALRAAYSREEVDLYLVSLLALDPGVWAPLEALVRARGA